MDAVLTHESPQHPLPHGRAGTWWQIAWPIALAVLVAAATAYGLTDGRAVAPVVAASGLVYLAAAATQRRWAAWVAFGIAFALITLDKFADLDAMPWLLALAGVLLVVGPASRRTHPWWALPLQTAAMLVLGATAVLALQLDPTVGGLLVAAALLGHAAWDIQHHRTGRVVDHALARFCAVLDVLVAVLVGAVTLTA
ncbi:hypothetical protein Q9R08_13795 [Microbacterium sp. QXD-8]|uniref:Lysoplasmalogenase n=1 Tax=Microbacterium psychrotolerans TaxID=3068321 RepID=A0ABU0Z388_9MICO|nr:hypothetical protein [Microbacterium sp. QXD-8]MDQ7879058.1 hypothetical protein [Microbacterium sp. QXD-8]